MLPQISIGPLVLPTAGLVYIIGAWIVLSVAERSARALALDSQAVYGLSATSLAAGFIGARLVFVALHWSAYRENLVGIVWPLTSGFSFWAGIVCAVVAGLFYGRAKRLPLAPTLDALAPAAIVALMVVSLADFLAGPGYGLETTLPWAVNLFGIRRHPVQIYELLVGVLALFAWWRILRRRRYEGQLFLASVAVYSGGRLLVDAFRANSWLTSNGFHLIQLASLAILLAAVFLMGRQVNRLQEPAQADRPAEPGS